MERTRNVQEMYKKRIGHVHETYRKRTRNVQNTSRITNVQEIHKYKNFGHETRA